MNVRLVFMCFDPVFDHAPWSMQRKRVLHSCLQRRKKYGSSMIVMKSSGLPERDVEPTAEIAEPVGAIEEVSSSDMGGGKGGR